MHYSEVNRLNVRSLTKLARETFGKELPSNVTKKDAVTLLVEMFAEEGDPLLGNPATVEEERDELTRPPTRMRIIIHSSENHEADVPLAVNGRTITVRRDEEVDIPLPHYKMLQNATMGSLERMEGDRPVIREHRRFNFSVLGEVNVATNELIR